jgi:hypothetical protein
LLVLLDSAMIIRHTRYQSLDSCPMHSFDYRRLCTDTTTGGFQWLVSDSKRSMLTNYRHISRPLGMHFRSNHWRGIVLEQLFDFLFRSRTGRKGPYACYYLQIKPGQSLAGMYSTHAGRPLIPFALLEDFADPFVGVPSIFRASLLRQRCRCLGNGWTNFLCVLFDQVAASGTQKHRLWV